MTISENFRFPSLNVLSRLSRTSPVLVTPDASGSHLCPFRQVCSQLGKVSTDPHHSEAKQIQHETDADSVGGNNRTIHLSPISGYLDRPVAEVVATHPTTHERAQFASLQRKPAEPEPVALEPVALEPAALQCKVVGGMRGRFRKEDGEKRRELGDSAEAVY